MSRNLLLAMLAAAALLLSQTNCAQSQTITLQVNATSNRQAISPDIYGIQGYALNSTTPAIVDFVKDIALPNFRWGGDSASRYNWNVDASNSGFDFYFVGGNGETTPTPGAQVDTMINTLHPAGARALITIPIIPYINSTSQWNCSYRKSIYGAQQSYDPYVTINGDQCGNSLNLSGGQIADTNIAYNNISNTTAIQQAWVTHLVNTFGTSTSDPIHYFQLDNEPGGWSNTHRDIMPNGATYPTIVSLGQQYATAIKQADPSALVFGPSDFTLGGWIGTTSQQNGLYAGQYYLQQFASYDATNGTRSLDYFDEHFYGNAGDDAAQIQSTRALWDPTYNSGTWVEQYVFDGPMQLLPRFHTWIDTYYPDTKLSISEYSMTGATTNIYDALTEVNTLGIFGQQGVGLANLWIVPAPTDPEAYAFLLYRDYDGNGSRFGDTSVSATSSDPTESQLAIFAAQRTSDSALTIIVVNETAAAIQSTLTLSNFTPTSAANAYTYSSANLSQIVHGSDVAVSSNAISYNYPAYSATLFVIAASSGSTLPQPTFSPAAGAYTSPQSVTMSDSTSGTTIYYTTNGTTPTTTSTVYSGPVTVSTSETLEAIAVKTGYTNSQAASAAYTITAALPAPTFSPAVGTYTTAQSVTISESTAGTTIYYTTNGTKPTTSSTLYSSPITVSSTETIEAIAVASGYNDSAVASAAYTINLSPAATPTFSVPAGTYSSAQTVSLSDTTLHGTIYYTTNGTKPTTSSTLYSSPITVSSTETIEAIAVASGYADSAVASATYTINLSPAATPTFSVPAGTYSSAQTVSLSDTTLHGTIYYTTDGTKPTTSSTLYSSPITVSSTETIEAIAVASGYADSAVASAAYTINLSPAATPTFSVLAGTYSSAQTVSLSDTTLHGTIYYTTNGTKPTTSSTLYSGPITVSSTETIEAIAVASGYADSAVASAAYTINLSPAATPTFSVLAGTYSSAQTVSLSDTTPHGTIHYTTNGTKPTTSSTLYSSPITVSSTETIEAIAVASGYADSAVASAAYTINLSPAATPTFSVPAGTYSSAQTVSLSDTTLHGTIYYTTNGTKPTTSSNLYSSPITVSSTETIEAIAGASGYADSAVASATYTINLSPAATPTFSIPAGTYSSAQTVSLSDTTLHGAIYYTTNGTKPTTSSNLYSSPITVSSTETIEAIAGASGYADSAVASATYTINLSPAATPTFSIPAGTYSSAQTVSLSDTTPHGTIYYTTNGTKPTTSSTLYSSPITVSSTETIEAIAVASGYNDSAVASATYTINLPAPSFTLAATPASLTVNSGQQGTVTATVTPQNGFNSTVTFACSGLPSGSSCAFSPATLTPSGNAASSTTLSITAPAQSAVLHRNSSPYFPATALAFAFCIAGWKKRRGLQLILLSAAAVGGLSLLSGCVRVASSSTTPSTVTVTATSGSFQQTATFSLTLN